MPSFISVKIPHMDRSSPPLEICRWFPQIMYSLFTGVRPINVRLSNHFFCLSDKRCLRLILKKNPRVRFLALKIAFFWGF